MNKCIAIYKNFKWNKISLKTKTSSLLIHFCYFTENFHPKRVLFYQFLSLLKSILIKQHRRFPQGQLKKIGLCIKQIDMRLSQIHTLKRAIVLRQRKWTREKNKPQTQSALRGWKLIFFDLVPMAGKKIVLGNFFY